jgi:hypothetical protein
MLSNISILNATRFVAVLSDRSTIEILAAGLDEAWDAIDYFLWRHGDRRQIDSVINAECWEVA